MSYIEQEKERMEDLAIKDLKDTFKNIKYAEHIKSSLLFAWQMGYLKAQEEARKEALKS